MSTLTVRPGDDLVAAFTHPGADEVRVEELDVLLAKRPVDPSHPDTADMEHNRMVAAATHALVSMVRSGRARAVVGVRDKVPACVEVLQRAGLDIEVLPRKALGDDTVQ